MKIQKTISLLVFLLPAVYFFSCSSPRQYLPDEVSGLSLKQTIEGKEAEDYVNRLHFNKVASEKNRIGLYEGTRGKAVIYVTEYLSGEAAVNDYQKMTKKISPGNSIFIGGEYIKVAGREMYRCYGMGQSHYVFADDKTLLWVSAELQVGDGFVKDYVSYLD